MTTMSTGPPEWQNTIRARLMAQQAQGDALQDVIEQCELWCAGAGRGTEWSASEEQRPVL